MLHPIRFFTIWVCAAASTNVLLARESTDLGGTDLATTNASAAAKPIADCDPRKGQISVSDDAARKWLGPYFVGRKTVWQAVDAEGLTEIRFDESCQIESATRRRLGEFERAARQAPVTLVIFWSPASGLENNNFQALATVGPHLAAGEGSILLLVDPLADRIQVDRILRDARLPAMDGPGTLWHGRPTRVFRADRARLADELPLCQFPTTQLWVRGREFERAGEWIGQFPIARIERALRSLNVKRGPVTVGAARNDESN